MNGNNNLTKKSKEESVTLSVKIIQKSTTITPRPHKSEFLNNKNLSIFKDLVSVYKSKIKTLKNYRKIN